MQATRASTRAFKAIAAAGSKQTRTLTTTGPTTFSFLLTSDKPASNSFAPRLPASAVIPVPEASETGSKVRHFNTSRSLKAIKDSSTIDFMHFPDFEPDVQSASVDFCVPILPWNTAPVEMKAEMMEADEPVMVPTIHTVAADGTHIHAPSAMSDMTDSNQFDYQGMATQAAQVASRLSKPVEEGAGMVRQILSGLMEDILGGPKHGSAKA